MLPEVITPQISFPKQSQQQSGRCEDAPTSKLSHSAVNASQIIKRTDLSAGVMKYSSPLNISENAPLASILHEQ